MAYQAPVRDYQFLIKDVFKTDQYSNLKGFADADSETVFAILEEAAKFTEEVVHPINITGDKEGCILNPDKTVTAPKGYKEAYKALTEAGWTALSNDPARACRISSTRLFPKCCRARRAPLACIPASPKALSRP